MSPARITPPHSLPLSSMQQLLLLMAAVDTAFTVENYVLAEELDAVLEARLDDLDHRLNDLDESDSLEEGGDVLDGDNHVGIEAQLIEAWSHYLAGIGSFHQGAELAAYLRSVFSDEALTGPYAPQPFLNLATDDELLAIAADVWNERQAFILGTR